MEKIRIGIVGSHRGSTFVRIFNRHFEETEVTAICDTDTEHVQSLKDIDYIDKDIEVFSDYDELLESGKIDAVMLANTFHKHAEFAVKAMKKGIAVLSETTAAPTLGECVELVETAEETKTKYMLAANCVYMPKIHAMKKYCDSGEFGKLLSGNAEYIHGGFPDEKEVIDENNIHWRKLMPPNYYNMHTLGPLMYVTGSMPIKVICKPIYDPEYCNERHFYKDCVGAMVITEMDNGAVFDTTGCNSHFPCTKWFRLAFENAAVETVKYSKDEDLIVAANNLEQLTTQRYGFVSSGVIDEKLYKEGTAEATGHGGADYFLAYYFIQYMLGKHQPFFDVYRSAALSATAILGWYSALSDGKEYNIPDFSKKEDRDKVRNDYRSPFANRYEDITLPCKITEKDKFNGCDL